MIKQKFSKLLVLLLSIGMLFNGLPLYDLIAYAEDEVVKIDRLSVSVRDGGKDVGGKYTWVTDGKEDSKDHRFTFRINYAISGTYDYEAEGVQIKIPKNILRNRDGNFADYYDISVPEWNDPDLEDVTDFVYKEVKEKVDPEDPNSEEVEYILIYNRIPVPGGTNGFIEVSYLTTERTWEYLDMGKSDDFFATMHVEQGEHADPENPESQETYIEVNKESNKIPVYIDTTAKITNIDKQTPKKLYRSWQDSWGNAVKPDNADDYFYLVWPIRTWITANQPYNFDIEDIFTAKNGFVAGYSLTNGNFKETYPQQYLKENYSNYSRYDYILTAHPKADYTEEEWQVKNSVRGHVDPYDQVDDDTYANDNAIFKYKAPKWQEPTGHFMLYKKGYKYSGEVSYWGGANSEEIRNYKLDQFKEGEINELTDLRYRVLKVGYAYPWTRNSALQDPSAFGHNPVKYVVTDNELFIGKLQNNDNDVKLDWQDANIYRLDFNLELWDANFDEEELKFSTGPRVSEFKDSEWVDFFVEVKNSGDYIKIARWNPQNGEYTSINNTYVQSASGKSIKFNRNDITGFKAEHSNARYYTELNLYPYVTLHNTDKVMNFIGEDMKIYVKNFADSKVYDYQDNEIVQFNDKFGYDYSMGIQTDGHITKKVKDTRNNKVKKNYVISWESSAYESFHDEEAVFRATEQSSGTFYDLLPLGGEYVNESIKVYGYKDGTLSEYNNAYQGGTKFKIEDFDISIKENYKKSGRDLLTIKINEPAEYYTIVYDTVHTWNNIKDYGKDVVNDIAYETGNEKIGDGKVDGSNNTFGKLDPDAGNAKKFLYEDAQHHISLITNALLNLKKQIRAAEDEHYSYKTRTYPDSDYYYNIRFATDDETTATDLMVMDSLENYTTASGETSAWRGSLKGINVKEIELLGADPKIYYSSVPNLDLEKYKNRIDYPDTNSVLADKIEDEAIWVNEETFGDPANATAFLVDIRIKQGGGKFILDYDTGVSMTVAMHSPKEVGALDHYNAYNNIYLWDTVHSKDGDVLEDSLVHQDFTQITYVVTADIPIHKVSAKDSSVAIKCTKWELKGDSVYGNNMDQEGTTDANGNYTFKKIEAGTYTLRETYVNNDYFINPTTYTVIISMDGSVQIGDGTEEVDGNTVVTNPLDTDNNRFVLTNEVRVHGDVEFTKVGLDTEEVIGEAYAVFDSADGSLTFFRDKEGLYTNEQFEGTKTYYTGIETINASKYEDIPWKSPKDNFAITTVKFIDVIKPISTAHWFEYGRLSNLVEFEGMDYLDTSNVTDMSCMFCGCYDLTTLDLSNFDTSNVTDMHSMFAHCYDLESLNLSHWDTSKVKDMNGMFYDCESLTSLDVSHFDTSNVENMGSMFNNCRSLTSLDVSHFATGKVTNMDYMFKNCQNLTTTLNIRSMPTKYTYMFADAATKSGAQITLKYIDPVTSANIDTLVATKSSNSNVVNGGEGTFIPPDTSGVYNASNRSHSYREDNQLTYLGVKPRLIGNTTFKLTGTSDYGTEYNEYVTSTSRGKVSFKDIEKGTYELIETKPNEDYINPNIKYTVTVDENGNVSTEGEDFIEKENGETYLQNEAWHNFSLRKTDAVNGGYLEGAEFKLVGTDEYGKEVDMHETSNSNGRVTFDPLASGTYILQEVKAPKNYEANSKKYVVEIDRLGNVKIDGLSQDEQGFFVFPDPRGQEGKIKIIKKWNDGKTGEDAENRDLPEITISTKEPEAKKGISVTKRWEGDTPEDRPDNIVVRLVKKVKKTVDPLWGEAYAVFDSADGSLIFFRDEPGKHTNQQIDGTKRYYTGIETLHATDSSKIPWHSKRSNVQSVTFQDTIKPVSTADWFSGMDNANFTNITGLEKLDTSNVTDMNCMFYNCSSLITIDISHFDTSKVTDMSSMFYSCTKLTSLDISHFDTSKVTDMNNMFFCCLSLTYLDASHFDTSNVTGMYSMFYFCEKLTTTLNVMNMSSSYDDICSGAATTNGAQITLKYISPVTSANIDTILALNYSSGNIVNGGQGELDTSGVWNSNNPSPSAKQDGKEIYENKVVETSRNWLDNRDGTWSYDFNHTQEEGDEYYVYEEPVDGYISDALIDTMKKVVNGVVEIVNTKQTEAYAVFDSADGSLTFFRDKLGKYNNNQVDGTKTYYTGIETLQATSERQIPWYSKRSNVQSITFQDPIKPVSTAYWFYEMSNTNFTEISGLEKLDTSNVTNMGSMFNSCTNLTSLDISYFDTSNVTDMRAMFYDCSNLTSLDVSRFDTSNVTDMSYMFNRCRKLASLDLSYFDTSNVTNMSYMFNSCRNLASLDISHFDTSNVTDIGGICYGCLSLTSLDVSHFDTSNVTNMVHMFNGCQSLTTLDVSHFDTSNVTNMGYMFYDCNNLTTTLNIMKAPSYYSMCYHAATENGAQITLKCIDPVKSVTIDILITSKDSPASNVVNGGQGTFVPPDTSGVWNENNPSPAKGGVLVNKSQNNMSNALQNSTSNTTNTNMQNSSQPKLLNNTKGEEEIVDSGIFNGISYKVTGNERDGYELFLGDANRKQIATGRISSNTNTMPWSATDTFMTGGRDYSTQLKKIHIIGEIELYRDSSGLFYNFKNAESIDGLELIDTSNVTNMDSMFSICSNLTSLDVSHFDTSNVSDMKGMFYGCRNLASLDVSHFDTSNVSDMQYMFYNCQNLTSLDLSYFDTSKVTNMCDMFFKCYSLTILDVSHFDTSNVSEMDWMFYNCQNLTSIALGDKSIFTIDAYNENWQQYATLSGRAIHEGNEFVNLSDYDGSNPGWYKVKGTTAPNEADMMDIYKTSDDISKWVKVDDETWEYTFNVFDDEAQYYVWESEIPNEYTTDTSRNNYQIINDGKGNYKQAAIWNHSYEKSEEFGNLKIEKEIKDFTESDSDAKFAFDIELKPADKSDQVGKPKYSHTPNISDDGTQNGIYSNNANQNEVITIPGARKLHVKVIYGGESASYDWACVWQGSQPDYTASSNYSSSLSGKLGGGSNQVWEQEISGNTVTIGFRSDGSGVGNGYGYYAVITPTGMSGDPKAIEGTKTFGDTVFKDGKATVYLKHGESITIPNLPVPYEYIVAERPNGDYPLDNKKGNTGELIGGETSTAKFVNKKVEVEEETGGFKLKKQVKGGFALFTDKFNFAISFTGLTPNKTYAYGENTFQTNENGEAEVSVELGHNEVIEFTNLPIGSRYAITELANEYMPSYTVSEANNRWNLIEKGQGSGKKEENLSTANEIVDEDEDITVQFTNTKDGILPTGVNNGISIILLIVLVVSVILFTQRKKLVRKSDV